MFAALSANQDRVILGLHKPELPWTQVFRFQVRAVYITAA